MRLAEFQSCERTARKKANCAMLLASAFPVTAHSHCEVGNRTIASTLAVDDPCVSDELSLPTVQSFSHSFGSNQSRLRMVAVLVASAHFHVLHHLLVFRGLLHQCLIFLRRNLWQLT
jgi:hypothetical protein